MMTQNYIRDLQYRDLILETIKTMVKSCSSLEGSLEYGTLTLIVNMGVVYKMDMSDQIPLDTLLAIQKKEIKVEGDKTETIWIVDQNQFIIWEVRERTRVFDNYSHPLPTIFYDENFHLNPLFMEMRASKTSAGGFRFTLDTTEDYKAIFILYKGIFNMLKNDTLSLEMWEAPAQQRGEILWLRFKLYKPKIKKSFLIYFAICNLYRRTNHDFIM